MDDDYLPERLVKYDTATVITQMIHPPKPVLVVNGEKPWPGMEVALVPVTYIRQPEYWEIHVVGSPGDIGGPPQATQLPAEPPVATQLPADPPVATQLPADPPVATQLPADPPVATQLPAESTAYSVQIDLAACTGTIGIEVVGANQTERIVVPSTAAVEE